MIEMVFTLTVVGILALVSPRTPRIMSWHLAIRRFRKGVIHDRDPEEIALEKSVEELSNKLSRSHRRGGGGDFEEEADAAWMDDRCERGWCVAGGCGKGQSR